MDCSVCSYVIGDSHSHFGHNVFAKLMSFTCVYVKDITNLKNTSPTKNVSAESSGYLQNYQFQRAHFPRKINDCKMRKHERGHGPMRPDQVFTILNLVVGISPNLVPAVNPLIVVYKTIVYEMEFFPIEDMKSWIVVPLRPLACNFPQYAKRCIQGPDSKATANVKRNIRKLSWLSLGFHFHRFPSLFRCQNN